MSLVVLAATCAAAAEYLVTVRPTWIELPPAVKGALQPVWPHAGAVVAAIVLFGIAAVEFAGALWAGRASVGLSAPSIDVARNPSGRLKRLPRIGLSAGLLLWAWVIVRLASAPTDLSLPGLFSIALVLVLATLGYHEWRRLAPRPSKWRFNRLDWLELLWVLQALGLFTFLMVFDLSSWYYSSIGDEHAFFLFAKDLALGDRGHSLFAQEGAYGIIPVLGSFFEAAQMQLFGINGIGWKVATITPAVLALAATYALARILFKRRVALLTLGFLATAHYLLAYGHSGYPNLEPLLPGVLAPLLFVVGIRRSSIALLMLAGVVAGFGWYTYYTSRIGIVVLAAATLLMVKPRSWLAAGAPVGLGFGYMTLPLLAVSGLNVFNTMFDQTGSGTTTEAAANRALLPLWNAGRTLLAFTYNTHDGIWLSGSLVDPMTGAWFVLGLASATIGWRLAPNRLLLAWFAIGVVVTGILSKYDYVSVSRMNYLMPIVCLFAAVAVDLVARLLEDTAVLRPARLAGCIFPVMLLGSTVLAGWGNLQRWFVDTPNLVPTSPTSVAIRIIQDPRCQSAPRPPLVVDTGIGGSIQPALEAAGTRVMPEFGLYKGPTDWIDSADSRCVIFRAPHDADAQALRNKVVDHWPSATAVEECDRSGIVRLIAYYPQTGGSNEASGPCQSRRS